MAAIDRSHGEKKSVVVCDPAILEGEPTVRGTRIAVRSIVLAAREFGDAEGVQLAYPHLDSTTVKEALAYYEAHRHEIDHYIEMNAADD